MGLEFNALQLKRAKDRLDNRQKAFKRYLIADMNKLANLVQRLARAMAPFDTGSLESSIYAKVNRDRYDRLFIELKVSESTPYSGKRHGVYVGDYAKYMHENHYRLGPRSRLKQMRHTVIDNKQIIIGRLFMERAVEHVNKKMPQLIRDAAAKAGFVER